MQVNGINETTKAKYAASNTEKEVKETKKPNVEGYEEKAAAPTNADLYKSMYGVKNEKSYAEQMADFRAKYELDVDDKNREIANNKLNENQPKQEKSYEEQYLEYKHKYE